MSTAEPPRSDDRSLTVQVPMTFRRSGGRKQVVTPEGLAARLLGSTRINNALVKAIGRAHRWQGLLETGAYASIQELATTERINPSYLARVLRLTLLAPEIVESILDGRDDPEHVTLDKLMKPRSAEWGAQVQGDL